MGIAAALGIRGVQLRSLPQVTFFVGRSFRRLAANCCNQAITRNIKRRPLLR